MGRRCTTQSKGAMVERYVNTAYDEMHELYLHLDELTAISEGFGTFDIYLGVHPAPPATRTNGDPIQNGDFYLKTSTNKINFWDAEDGEWVEMDMDVSYVEELTLRAEAAAAESVASKDAAAMSETNAATSETNAFVSAGDAQSSKDAAKASEEAALISETNAANSEANARSSEINAAVSAATATASSAIAVNSAADALTSETNAGVSETNAATSETNAAGSATLAQAWATNPEGTPVVGTEFSAYHWAKFAERAATSAIVSGGTWTPTALVEYPTPPVGATTDIIYMIQFADASDNYTYGTGDLHGITVHSLDIIFYDISASRWEYVPNPAAAGIIEINGKMGASVTLTSADINHTNNLGVVATTEDAIRELRTDTSTNTLDIANNDARITALDTRTTTLETDVTNIVTGVTEVPKATDADTVDGLEGTDLVHIAGTQTVTGNKAFTGNVDVQTPVNLTHAVNKGYMESVTDALDVRVTANEDAISDIEDGTTPLDVDKVDGLDADDFVQLLGTQTITGDKTFVGTVTVQTPMADGSPATKLYVDNADTALDTRLTAAEDAIDDIEDGTTRVPLATDADTVDGLHDVDLVQIAGTQGITGDKTFIGAINVSTPTATSHAVNKGTTDALDTRITTNEADITALTTRVTDNEADITALDGRVSAHDVDLAGLTTRMSDAEADITANETAITLLDGRVATNTVNIGLNTAAIATNDTDIANLDTRVTTLEDTDITLTLAGDATGTATFTDLGDATLTVTVVDDSHDHTIANVDNLQTELDNKVDTSRRINTNANSGLTGGGDLTADRTMSVDIDGTSEITSPSLTDVVLVQTPVGLRKVQLTNLGTAGGGLLTVRGTVTLDAGVDTGTVHDSVLGDVAIDDTTYPAGAVDGWAYFVDADAAGNTITGLSENYEVGNLLVLVTSATFPWGKISQGVQTFNGRTDFVTSEVGDYDTWFTEIAGDEAVTGSWGFAQPVEVANATTANHALNQTVADTRYVEVAGDTMTGDLTAPNFIGDLTGNADTATDSDTLDGQHGAFYQNADNLNAGTIDDARLPNTITSDITGNAATATDADTLDGEHGAFYQDASNLNAGTIDDARLPDTITSDISGNAATADKWTTARTVSLTGDATGSVAIDGSADASITVTVVDDSHDHVIANVDGLQTELDSAVKLTGDQTITGTKTFDDVIVADVVDVNEQLQLPVEDARTGTQADMRFNPTTSKFEGHNGTKWGSIGGGGAGVPRTVTTDATLETGEYLIFDDATATGDVVFTLPDATATTEDFFTVGFKGRADYKITLTSTRNIMEVGENTFEFQNPYGSFTFVLDDNDMWRISSSVGESEAPSAVRNRVSNYYPVGTSAFPIIYDLGFVDVWVNGFKMPRDEFTATDGATVTLTTPLAVESYVEIVAWNHMGVTGLPLPFLDALHPVGSVVLRMDAVDPSSLYGGTWALITGDAALSFGNGAVQSGSVTGTNAPTVPIPQHSHGASFSGNALPTHSHTKRVFHQAQFEHATSGETRGGTQSLTGGTGTKFYTGGNSGSVCTLRMNSADQATTSDSSGTPSGAVTVDNAGTAGVTLDTRGARISINVWQRTA